MTSFEASKHRSTAVRLLAWVLALVAMLAVFVAYLDPQLMVTLGNAVWSCL